MIQPNRCHTFMTQLWHSYLVCMLFISPLKCENKASFVMVICEVTLPFFFLPIAIRSLSIVQSFTDTHQNSQSICGLLPEYQLAAYDTLDLIDMWLFFIHERRMHGLTLRAVGDQAITLTSTPSNHKIPTLSSLSTLKLKPLPHAHSTIVLVHLCYRFPACYGACESTDRRPYHLILRK